MSSMGIAIGTTALAVLAGLSGYRRRTAQRARAVRPDPVVSDSVFGYHGEPAEDSAEGDAYCPGCRRITPGITLSTGAFMCWAHGHVTDPTPGPSL